MSRPKTFPSRESSTLDSLSSFTLGLGQTSLRSASGLSFLGVPCKRNDTMHGRRPSAVRERVSQFDPSPLRFSS